MPLCKMIDALYRPGRSAGITNFHTLKASQYQSLRTSMLVILDIRLNGYVKAERSNIHITERTRGGTKRILDQNALRINTKINHIIQSGVP